MFRELELSWSGVSKRLKPTMDLLRYLEQQNLGPHAIANLAATKRVSPATYCAFVGSVLRYAGYDVTDEQVYLDAHTAQDGFKTLATNAMAFSMAMLPTDIGKVDEVEKKPQAAKRQRKPAAR